jgi:hypothetical protein
VGTVGQRRHENQIVRAPFAHSTTPFVVATHNVLCYAFAVVNLELREACMIFIALLAAPGLASRLRARPSGKSPQTI